MTVFRKELSPRKDVNPLSHVCYTVTFFVYFSMSPSITYYSYYLSAGNNWGEEILQDKDRLVLAARHPSILSLSVQCREAYFFSCNEKEVHEFGVLNLEFPWLFSEGNITNINTSRRVFSCESPCPVGLIVENK